MSEGVHDPVKALASANATAEMWRQQAGEWLKRAEHAERALAEQKVPTLFALQDALSDAIPTITVASSLNVAIKIIRDALTTARAEERAKCIAELEDPRLIECWECLSGNHHRGAKWLGMTEAQKAHAL